jgi:hypothetical protein
MKIAVDRISTDNLDLEHDSITFSPHRPRETKSRPSDHFDFRIAFNLKSIQLARQLFNHAKRNEKVGECC